MWSRGLCRATPRRRAAKLTPPPPPTVNGWSYALVCGIAHCMQSWTVRYDSPIIMNKTRCNLDTSSRLSVCFQRYSDHEIPKIHSCSLCSYGRWLLTSLHLWERSVDRLDRWICGNNIEHVLQFTPRLVCNSTLLHSALCSSVNCTTMYHLDALRHKDVVK